MPANDEFPRGWAALHFPAAGVALGITIPAVPGVQHVLDAFTVRAINNGAGVEYGPVNLLLNSSGGEFTNYGLATLHLPGAGSTDEVSEEGLGIVISSNNSLTVSMAGGNINSFLRLIIKGHDI